MALTYPLAFPTVETPCRITPRKLSAVGVGESPYTFSQETFSHPGERWAADVKWPPMSRAAAETVIAFLLALNGREGTFLMRMDFKNSTPRGTWAGTAPLVAGANQTGRTLRVDGLAAGVTAKAGDWFSLGSGTSTRLHKVVVDTAVLGSPLEMDLDIVPALREAPADNAALTLASPQGVFRLTTNQTEWSVDLAEEYGVSFSCEEAL